ncbi:hypothetical protein K402DRAFT_398216 [Aulographum hederae CBS 113979]|uniref:Thioesterase/thiol ester dehydrase-isomerase n=1 Tax=Aulographum hederae CBS 113979 TaxID=1176131 RepID=A0A6G1GM35_9PEZI|nr:hypothetical protein K402DRAFT_398216 [Aulographum hederae CBS 113979]
MSSRVVFHCTRLQLRLSLTSVGSTSRRTYSTANSFDHLKTSLPQRTPKIYYDSLSAFQSNRLESTLATYVPSSWLPNLQQSHREQEHDLPAGHHLVHFNPLLPADQLLADGTDPSQSPGEPFVRRMWAGGNVRFATSGNSLKTTPDTHVCVEGIRDVSIKGVSGQEKVFVGIERRIGSLQSKDESEEAILRRLWPAEDTATASDMGAASLIERRNIVFMREKSPEELKQVADRSKIPPTKILKPQHEADFSHAFVPTPSLLFRYSALTLNAHAIHLNPTYCRDVEGHRERLFHGPLAFTVLVKMLEVHLRRARGQERIGYIEYRNLAPLYCSEPVKLCGKEIDKGKYELWVETPEGGIAVKATATAVKDPSYHLKEYAES